MTSLAAGGGIKTNIIFDCIVRSLKIDWQGSNALENHKIIGIIIETCAWCVVVAVQCIEDGNGVHWFPFFSLVM